MTWEGGGAQARWLKMGPRLPGQPPYSIQKPKGGDAAQKSGSEAEWELQKALFPPAVWPYHVANVHLRGVVQKRPHQRPQETCP